MTEDTHSTGGIEVQPAVLVPHFLGQQRQVLLNLVLREERDFLAATVAVGASGTRVVLEEVRRARILNASLGEFESTILERIKQQLQPALPQLGCKEFPIGRIELQATASNDGDYFRLHVDGGPDGTRRISFVYFLHGEPRRFSGGELRIQMASHSVDVSPAGDTLVLFRSESPHEVLPVHVPSGAFSDSRFTLNGWIHQR